MNKAYLLTGGNLGDRAGNLLQAMKLIEVNCGTVTKSSAMYETAAWGYSDQPGFLNQALLLETSLGAAELMTHLLEIEKEIGRIRLEKYGPRAIDIDILLFNDEIYDEPHIRIPHPQLPNRRFALTPLAEIAGQIIHPVLLETIEQLLANCPDPLKVKRIGSR
ncbi:MAG: 2-amino-4-hydroxy-6-hydroxymethyldihydropteridine diphosphokinase [Chitinophagaceae bacterium]|nr:2-amino-4-hydroxy-6-hydroxymethyldihydropteridine diphosphokinase [Chitinophagaceae bacterium]